MNNRLSQLWLEVLEVLKFEVTEVAYNTWIKTIIPVSMHDHSIILGAPIDFNKSIIDARYLPLIKNTIQSLTSREYDISIVLFNEADQDKKIENEKNYQDEPYNTTLNPKYTFDTFVIGNSNRFAHAASLAVAESPAHAYNPLFLYGGVGLGKTHLIHAIGNYILKNNPSSKVVYVSSEKFTNELINAIKDDRNEDFRNKYRSMDVLLVDDIQFIGGKERTQEEFFHTFNTLYEANKQIILTSDRPPKEINTLEERLRSRFEWGLIGDMQPPDLETRVAILKKKAQIENLRVPDELFIYIASKIKSNIRELEGALNRIIAFSELVKQDITIDLAEEALKDILDEKTNKIITARIIQENVATHFNIRLDDFKSKRRTKNISYPRQIAMYLCRDMTELSLPKIGEAFGGRDHTTVLHAVSKIEGDISRDSEIKNAVTQIIKNIKEK